MDVRKGILRSFFRVFGQEKKSSDTMPMSMVLAADEIDDIFRGFLEFGVNKQGQIYWSKRASAFEAEDSPPEVSIQSMCVTFDTMRNYGAARAARDVKEMQRLKADS
ncbi:MAG: hypothetical protein HRU40_22285, partial [Saprospiraceae bacterium]|nr:hypothetical protein [Saprospiraceae bacterium]